MSPVPLPEPPPAIAGEVALGYDLGLNDPYALRHGPRLAAGVWLADQVRIGALGAWYPLHDGSECTDADWTTASCALVEVAGVAPDVSPIQFRTAVEVAWAPLRVSGAWSTTAGLTLAAGGVQTVDDPAVLGLVDGGSGDLAEQWHPYYGAGLAADVHSRTVGFRGRLDVVVYQEVVIEGSVEDKRPVFGGIDVYYRF